MELDIEELDYHYFGGQRRYHCPEETCEFDHYNLVELRKHWINSHMQKKQQPASTLFDADDKPIKREEKIYVPKPLQRVGSSSAYGADDLAEFPFGSETTDSAD
jgi:hypothetical protein